MTDITIQQVVAKVRELAAENPDFVYRPTPGGDFHMSCAYVHDEDGTLKPGCIVGAAVIALGVDPKRIVDNRWNTEGAVSLLSRLGILGPNPYGDGVDGPLKSWLDKVQMRQDDRNPWSEAVRRADLDLPEVASP